MVLVHNGRSPATALPQLGREERLAFFPGRAVPIRAPWNAVAANAFDLQHLQGVHHRALTEEPRVSLPAASASRLEYTSRVIGTTLSDRTMRRLSNDTIRVRITNWGGPLMTVETELGRIQTALALAFTPTAEGTIVTPAFGVGRSGWPLSEPVRGSLARWLFTSFLARDIGLLDDIRWNPNPLLPADEVVAAFNQFIADRPAAAEAAPLRMLRA